MESLNQMNRYVFTYSGYRIGEKELERMEEYDD